MTKDSVILIADDDQVHFELIRKGLLRAGVSNEIIGFADGVLLVIVQHIRHRGQGHGCR